MVVYTYQLLKEREDIRRRWQAQFRYLLIDEFQDINRLQYETVCMLAEPENNLFIVGDDDQSIYGFRGAKPGIMLSFPKRFPDTKQIVLGLNYRCSDEIMKAAERLIGKNNERYEKHIVANKGKEQPVHMKNARIYRMKPRRLWHRYSCIRKRALTIRGWRCYFGRICRCVC